MTYFQILLSAVIVLFDSDKKYVKIRLMLIKSDIS